MNKFFTINQISVLGSSICDLHCSYCYLHEQHNGDAYKIFNDMIQKNWKDGSYVDNIKKVFKKLECDPTELTRFEIWGGEPLICIHNLVEPIKQLMDFFPNISFFLIPTNWAYTNINNLINFIYAIDSSLKNRESNKMDFHLQLSIDGPPGEFNDNGHPGKWQNYRKNITTFCEKIESNNLKNIRVVFEVHPTASGKLIYKKLSTADGVRDYYNYMYNFLEFIRNEIKRTGNNYVECGQTTIFPMMAVPERSSVENGIDFGAINRLNEFVQKEIGQTQKISFGEHLYHHTSHSFGVDSIITANCQCTEAGGQALMLAPDGTICECACSYIQYYDQYIQQMLDTDKDEEYRIAMMRKKYFFNPLTATDKELEEYYWYTLYGLRNTESVQISLAMSMCQELAISGQIDYKYYLNPELLLRHLNLAGGIYSCTREQISDSRIPFLVSPEDCRKMLNGYIDFVSGNRQEESRLLMENAIKNGTRKTLYRE